LLNSVAVWHVHEQWLELQQVKHELEVQNTFAIEKDDQAWVVWQKSILLDPGPRVSIKTEQYELGVLLGLFRDLTGINTTLCNKVDDLQMLKIGVQKCSIGEYIVIVMEAAKLVHSFRSESLSLHSSDCNHDLDLTLDIYDISDLIDPNHNSICGGISIELNDQNKDGLAFDFDEDEEDEEEKFSPDKIQQLVTDFVGKNQWDEPASVTIHRGQLLINQSSKNHKKIFELLSKLRHPKRFELDPDPDSKLFDLDPDPDD